MHTAVLEAILQRPRRGLLGLNFSGSQFSRQGQNFALVTDVPGWSFTRASVAWSKDSLGNDVQFLSGVPRITDLGLLVEESRTNFLLNSTAPVTQTTGSLGTGTYTLWIVGSGSAAITAGTGTATGLGTATAASPVTITVTVAGTFTVTNTGSVTFFQLENGAFVTSRIVTAGATSTRAADVAFIAQAVATPFSAVAWASIPSLDGIRVDALAVSDGTAANRLELQRDTDNRMYASLNAGSVYQTAPGSAATKTGARVLKIAARVGPDEGQAFDGVSTADSSVTLPTGLNKIYLGSNFNGTASYLNGYLQRASIYGSGLSNSQLQALTQ